MYRRTFLSLEPLHILRGAWTDRIPLCSSVEYPPDQVNALESNEHVHVEQDAEVKTQ